MNKLILHFDINGTITTVDSTDDHLDTSSRVNVIISKSVFGKVNEVGEWVMNDDPFLIGDGDTSYYNHLKKIGSKHLAYVFTNKGELGEPFRKYYDDIVKHELGDIIFRSFLKVLDKYNDAKLVLRTFGNDGPMIVDHINTVHGYEKPFIYATYVRTDDQHMLKLSNDEIIGLKNISDFISQHPDNICIKDDYEYWCANNNYIKHKGKPLIVNELDVQIFFDDNDCVVTYGHKGDLKEDTYFNRINCIQAMLDHDYYIRLIDAVWYKMYNPVLAHRGVMLNGQMENSYESLTGIKRYDRDSIGIEFDVQQIGSGEIICYHDEDLKRLHNSDLRVSELTDEDVVKYKLPYLREILNEFAGSQYILNIEMKSYDEMSDVHDFCHRVAKTVANFNLNDNVIISSFDPCIIMNMLNNHPWIKSSLLIYGEIPDETIDNFITIGLRKIAIDKAQYLNTEKYLSKGLNVMVYTLFDANDKNDDEIVKYLSKYKYVTFITDRIDKLL